MTDQIRRSWPRTLNRVDASFGCMSTVDDDAQGAQPEGRVGATTGDDGVGKT